MKRLSAEALDILGAVKIEGHEVTITSGQLDRKLYLEVNSALEALGGKWSRKRRAHVFDGDPADELDQVLVDGAFYDKKRDLEQFFTPPALARQVVEAASVRGKKVLEPSAGHGALALEAVEQGAEKVWCVDIDERACQALSDATLQRPDALERIIFRVTDFLTMKPSQVDRVVMNPPFSRGKDIAHVLRAYQWLVDGGLLVAIMSAGVTFRRDKAATAFRAMVSGCGFIEPLPEGSFRESGTDVRAVMVTMRRRAS